MTPRRFPRSPVIAPRPFDGGQNPFADDVSTPVTSSDNPLAPPANDEVQPFKATEFDETQPDRSDRVLLLGSIGAGFVGASLLIAVVVVFTTSLFATELVYCWPADLLGLALCIPAWVMARNHLRAIRAGVMNDSGLRVTRIGYWCGVLGSCFGVLPFVGVIVAIVLSMLA